MKPTDEALSAFLDAQLNPEQMDSLRQQLAEDEQLTERLADLAMVDSLVQQYYAQIDQQPMPAAVLQLLQDEQPPVATVIAFPWWRRAQQQLQQHAAAVACIALVAGYGVSQLSGPAQPVLAGVSTDVVKLLNSAASGHSYPLAEQQLTPRLSFTNQQGNFCRQYGLQSASGRSEHIACRSNGIWQQHASLSLPGAAHAAAYQTASGGSLLDSVLDSMMAGPPLNAAAEQAYLHGKSD